MIANTMPSLLIIDDHTCGSRKLVKTLSLSATLSKF